MRRLYLDIETSPLLVCSWGVGRKINIAHDNVVQERQVICICWKFDGESKVHSLQWENGSDKDMLKAIVPVLAEADEIVGHNLKRFDLPWIKARCAFHRIATEPKYTVVDTLLIARRDYRFVSNRLDYLGKFLGVGGKIKTEFGLWKAVTLDKSESALRKMVRYCKSDVLILESVHHKLAIDTVVKTHAGVLGGGEKWSCPRCESEKVRINKTKVTAAGTRQTQFQCIPCGGYFSVNDKTRKDYEAEMKRRKK